MPQPITIDNHLFHTEQEAQGYLDFVHYAARLLAKSQYHIKVSLPLPPSINEQYADVIKTGRNGRLYTRRIASKALKAYKRDVHALLAEQQLLSPRWQQAKRIGYAICISVRRKNADASNYLKAYEDAVTEALGIDDSHIYHGTYEKQVDPQRPRIDGYWYLFA